MSTFMCTMWAIYIVIHILIDYIVILYSNSFLILYKLVPGPQHIDLGLALG